MIALWLSWLLAQEPSGDPRALALEAPLEVRADFALPPGIHVVPAAGERGEQGVLVLRGLEGVVLELTGAELRGAPPDADPDRLEGYGILIEDCVGVTVRGGRLGGYRGCIVARRTRGLVIEDVSFDGWFAQRLRSTSAAEDPADWLWPHENDAGEWLASYGAAISLSDSSDFEIRRCRGRRGQNGILLTRCAAGRVYDDDFSFLSGWGLALYRSSRNVVARNVFDYCVRGYSHGVYWRGQDSAGILMFERCSDNVIALNSATHGGDGLFLFAGQDIVQGRAFERGETEVGGSDRNLVWRNDFSYAVANAVEMTFSRGNAVIENLGRGARQHGLWGGYSSRMLVRGNDFGGAHEGGITIEHGQECVLEGNRLEGCGTGIELYWDEDPELVGGPFGRRFDTDSRGHWLVGNRLEGCRREQLIERTHDLRTAESHPLPEWWPHASPRDPAELPGTRVAVPFEEGLAGADRPSGGLETIVIGEWGPWDFRSGAPRPPPRR